MLRRRVIPCLDVANGRVVKEQVGEQRLGKALEDLVGL